MTDPRREIPSVDRLLGSDAFAGLLAGSPRALVVEAIHEVQESLRAALVAGDGAPGELSQPRWYAERAADVLARIARPSLRPVINATGVVLHTNLGRAPLADAARAAIARVAGAGYSNLEYDLDRGERGSRYDHCARLLCRLTGAEAALVVNNNAAALVLALNTLAQGRASIISRGELVEIGGSFRVPEIMARSGTRMVEVGATNRTHASDYAAALTSRVPGALPTPPDPTPTSTAVAGGAVGSGFRASGSDEPSEPTEAALVLKVHRSNFRLSGYVAEVAPAELATLAHAHGVPLLHDLGSGLLIPAASLGLPHEPTPAEALAEGADVVTLSGDKLLGGPQAGILVGRLELIARMRRNPLCRALRVDKLTLAALEATLRLYLDPERAVREIPVLRMLTASEAELRARAERFAERLRAAGIAASVVAGVSAVGGGAYPDASLPGTLVQLPAERIGAGKLDARLRNGEPHVVARIMDDRVTLDLRTVDQTEEEALAMAVLDAWTA